MFEAGHAGVDLFFVLSGFIIMSVHFRDIGQPQQLSTYARRRFDRVMPLYWLALALTIAMGVLAGHSAPSTPWVLWSASLLPSPHEPILGIAWTLQCEVVFYVFFALLIYNPASGVAAMGSWLIGLLAALVLPASYFAPLLIFNAFGLEFFFGMTAAWVVLRGSVSAPRLLATVGAVAFIAALVAESAGYLFGFGVAARFAYGVPAALLICGLATTERSRSLAVPSWLISLGGASYSIYLFQFVFIGAVWQAWLLLGLNGYVHDWLCFVVLAASAVVGGIVVSLIIEKPLLQTMRGRPAIA